jgi:hypothetical protein
MAQPRNLAWDTPELLATVLVGFRYQVLERSTLHQISMLGGFTSPGISATTHYSDKTGQRLVGPTLKALAAK